MAKRKVDIAKQLDALNPGVPTRTRKKGEPAGEEPIPAPSEQISKPEEKRILPLFGAAEVFRRNVSTMEKLRSSMVEDAIRFQNLFFESWGRTYGIVCDAMKDNFDSTRSRQ